MTLSRPSILLLLSLSILLASSVTLAGNVIVRNGQLNVSAGIYSDSDTLYIDSENDRVGIGTTGPNYKLEVSGTTAIKTEGVSGEENASLYINNTGTSNSFYQLRTASGVGDNFVITNAGNVGIGTTNPTNPLHILTSSNPSIKIETDDNSSYSYFVLDSNKDSGTSSTVSEISFQNNADSIAYIKVYEDGATNAGQIRIGTQPAGGSILDRLTIISNGSVGIGTTNPTSQLHMYYGTTSNESGLLIENYAPNIKLEDISTSRADYQLLANSGFFIKRDSDSDGTFESVDLTIDESGRIGIGTTTPDAWFGPSPVLQMNGTRPTLVFSPDTEGNFGTIVFKGSYNSSPMAEDEFHLNYYSNSSDPYLRISGYYGGYHDILTVKGNGYVGIGTTEPNSLLHLSGGKIFVENVPTSVYPIESKSESEGRALQLETSDYVYNSIGSALTFKFVGGTGNASIKMDAYNDGKKQAGNLVFQYDSGGSVGIGTTTPLGKQHIYSASAGAVSKSLVLENHGVTNNSGTSIYMGYQGNATNPFGIRLVQKGYPSSYKRGSFEVQRHDETVGDSDSNWITSLMIDDSGKVGIGTTTPEANLHINGSGDDLLWVIDSGNTNGLRIGTDGNLLDFIRIRPTAGDGIAITNNGDNIGVFVDSVVGKVGINTTDPGYALDVHGTIGINTFPQVGSDPMCWDGSGESSIGDCSSLREFKENITDYSPGLTDLLKLTPRIYDWKNGSIRNVGFIAEEVNEVVPSLSKYRDGNLTGYQEFGMSALLVNSVKELKEEKDREIAILKAEKDGEIQELRSENDALKEVVCMDHPEAGFCTPNDGGDGL